MSDKLRKLKNLSDKQLVDRVNSLYARGKNDDDEVGELFRRSKEKGFKVIPKWDTYEIEYAKGGKIKKYTQKDNIIKSGWRYAIIDDNGKEIEGGLTLDDAKETIKELNQKSKFKRTGERAGFDMRGLYAKGGKTKDWKYKVGDKGWLQSRGYIEILQLLPKDEAYPKPRYFFRNLTRQHHKMGREMGWMYKDKFEKIDRDKNLLNEFTPRKDLPGLEESYVKEIEGSYAKGGKIEEIKLEIEKLKKENPEGFKTEIESLEERLEWEKFLAPTHNKEEFMKKHFPKPKKGKKKGYAKGGVPYSKRFFDIVEYSKDGTIVRKIENKNTYEAEDIAFKLNNTNPVRSGYHYVKMEERFAKGGVVKLENLKVEYNPKTGYISQKGEEDYHIDTFDGESVREWADTISSKDYDMMSKTERKEIEKEIKYLEDEQLKFAKGGSVKRSNRSPLLKYVNFEDGSHINLKILVPTYQQGYNPEPYIGNKRYGISRQGIGQNGKATKQEIWEFKKLKEAEKKFNELVNLGKASSKIEKQGEIKENYSKWSHNNRRDRWMTGRETTSSKYLAKGGKLIGFTNDPIYTQNDISVQRIGGSTMWNVAYKGETKGTVLDAFTKEQAVRKFEKTKDDYFAKGGSVKDNKMIREDLTDAINEFDDDYYEYRAKWSDVIEYNGDWFVDYITQEDYRNDGEYILMNALEELSKYHKVDIYLWYIVRDDVRENATNVKTKKGYTKVSKRDYAKGGEVKKKENNEMIMGGLAGILLGIFLNK